eukprot:jgi/Bigna1/78717/fgenesh1_pg.56_\
MGRNAVVESKLVLKDDSIYSGQVCGSENSKYPHGFGRMRNKDGFTMTGYFLNGKNVGAGIFTTPSGDEIFGEWNEEFKRHGRHMAVFSTGKLQLQTFDNGKFKKACAPRMPADTKTHWKTPNITKALVTESEEMTTVSGHTVCRVGGHLLMFGGERLDQESHLLKSTNDLYIYDEGGKKWAQVKCEGKIPPPSHSHTATAIGSKMVIIGGRDGMLQHGCVHVLDMATGAWKCVVSKGVNLASHSATLIGKKIYCIVSGTVFVLDTRTWSWEQPDINKKIFWKARVPHATIGHSAVGVGREIFVFGGMITQENLASRGVSGPETKKKLRSFEGIPSPSWKTPRCDHGAILLGDEMIVVGGFTTSNPNLNVIDSSFLNDVQILNIETLEWRTPPITRAYSPPTGSHTVEIFDDETNDLCIIGGNSLHNFVSSVVIMPMNLFINSPYCMLGGIFQKQGGGIRATPGQKEGKPILAAKKQEDVGTPRPLPPAQSDLKKSSNPDQKESTIILDKARKETSPPQRIMGREQALPRDNPDLTATIPVVQKATSPSVTPTATVPTKKKGWGAAAGASVVVDGFDSLFDDDNPDQGKDDEQARLNLDAVDDYKDYMVKSWLEKSGKDFGIKEKTIAKLVEEDIDGESLLSLSPEEMRSIGITLGQVKALVRAIESFM